MANQNITLSLPEEDLREARVLAARRGTTFRGYDGPATSYVREFDDQACTALR